jgi:WD40-like Beta Propeller Repeat
MVSVPLSKRSAACAALVAVLGILGCQSSEAPATQQAPSPPPAPRPEPPPAAAPQQIAFDMQTSSGPRNIYAMRLDGTGLVQLTSDSADHHDPTVHDSLLAFGSVRPGGVVIASIEMGAGRGTPAVFGPGDAPMVSPNGSTFAYLSMASGAPLVWTAGVDGGQAQRFASAQGGWSGASEAHPVWSPTGDRIAYVSTRAGNAAIYVGAVAGAVGSAALLTSSPTGASVEPAWSPDGTQIVFTSNRDGPTDLYVVTLGTGAVTRLTTLGNVGQATWLADGRIVFTQWTASVAGLVWLDPSNPTVLHPLSTGGDTQHAAAYP